MAITTADYVTLDPHLNLNVTSAYQSNVSTDYYHTIYDEPSTFKKIIDSLNKYAIPIIVAVGTSGNVISFIVFLWTSLSNMSSSVYLAALAIADTGFLLSLFLGWTSWTELDLFHRKGWCPIIVYTTYVFSFLSVWYVVSFSVERYVAVCYPLRRQVMCTTKRAKIVTVSLAVFALVFYSFAAWTSDIRDVPGLELPECLPHREHFHMVTIFNNIDTVFTLIVPFITIVMINVRICCKMVYVYRKRRLLSQQYILQDRDRISKHDDFIPERICDQQQIRITKMLLIVSSTFLLLNLPSHAFRLYGFFGMFLGKSATVTPVQVRWQELCQFLYYINFAINFFLYSVCGRNFRMALTQCRCCLRIRGRMRLLTRSHSSMSWMTDSKRKSGIESATTAALDQFS